MEAPPESGPLVRQCTRCRIPNWHTNLNEKEHCPFCADDLRIARHFRRLAAVEQNRIIEKLPDAAKIERRKLRKKLEVSDIAVRLQKEIKDMRPNERTIYLRSIGLVLSEEKKEEEE